MDNSLLAVRDINHKYIVVESIDAGTGRHIDRVDFLFYGSAFEI